MTIDKQKIGIHPHLAMKTVGCCRYYDFPLFSARACLRSLPLLSLFLQNIFFIYKDNNNSTTTIRNHCKIMMYADFFKFYRHGGVR